MRKTIPIVCLALVIIGMPSMAHAAGVWEPEPLPVAPTRR
jgi:hypothetical protein